MGEEANVELVVSEATSSTESVSVPDTGTLNIMGAEVATQDFITGLAIAAVVATAGIVAIFIKKGVRHDQ